MTSRHIFDVIVRIDADNREEFAHLHNAVFHLALALTDLVPDAAPPSITLLGRSDVEARFRLPDAPGAARQRAAIAKAFECLQDCSAGALSVSS